MTPAEGIYHMGRLAYNPDDCAAEQIVAHLNLAARCAGWADHCDLAIARTEFELAAWRVIEWCAAIGRILPTWADLLDVMEDRFAAGVLRLTVCPFTERAFTDEMLRAAKVVMREHQSRERRANMGDAIACADGPLEDHPFAPREIAA